VAAGADHLERRPATSLEAAGLAPVRRVETRQLDRRRFLAAAAGLPLAAFAPAGKRILVLGDSVSWGQGLLEPDKMQSRLSRAIFQRDGVEPSVLSYAVSGAVIGDPPTTPPIVEGWWPREAPRDNPTLYEQCDRVALEHPDPRFDAIVVAGGINDVNVRKIFDPRTAPAAIVQLSRERCYGRMSRFLDRVRCQFVEPYPAAKVLVLGYYSVFSDQSDPTDLKAVVKALIRDSVRIPSERTLSQRSDQRAFLDLSPEERLRAAIIKNSQTFRDASRADLIEAVRSADQVAPNFHFVDPKITDEEAAFAPKALIFGLDRKAQATDDLREDRKRYCQNLIGYGGLDRFTCFRASVGHPNKAGAQRYADTLATLI
jgi:lysophospholipase L1-like esterase